MRRDNVGFVGSLLILYWYRTSNKNTHEHFQFERNSHTMSPSIPPAPYAAVHASPSGPGDARPTAAHIVTDNNLLNALTGKTILVTGGSSGLGVDIVRQLAKTGARVLFTSRDVARGEKVRETLETDAREEGREARIEVVEMELGRLSSVRSAAEDVLRRLDQSEGLNVLVNNAGEL